MGKSSPNSEPDDILRKTIPRRKFLQGLGLAIGGLVVGGCDGGDDPTESRDATGGAGGRGVERQMQSTKNATGGVLLDEASRAEKDEKVEGQEAMEAKMEKSRELVAQLLGIYNGISHRIEAAEADSENGLEKDRPYAESMARRLPSALTKDFDRAKKALTNLLAHFGEPEDWMSGSSSWSRLSLMEAQKLACLLSAMAYDTVGEKVDSWVLYDEKLRKGDTGSLADGADNYFGDDPGAAAYVIDAQKGRVYEELLSGVSRIKKWNSAIRVESPRIESLKRKQKLQHDSEKEMRPAKGVEHSQRQLLDHERAQRASREIDRMVSDARIDEMSVEALQQYIAKQERDLKWLRDSNIPRKKKSLREEFPDRYEAQYNRIFIEAQADIARDEKRVGVKEKWIVHCKEKLEAKKVKAAAKKHR